MKKSEIFYLILISISLFLIYMHYYKVENFDNKFGFEKSKNLFIINEGLTNNNCLYRNNNNISLNSCLNIPNSWWKIDDKSRIINMVDNKCLNNTGSNIAIQTCGDQTSYQFNINDNSELINLMDNKCVTRTPNNTLEMQICSNIPNNKWKAEVYTLPQDTSSKECGTTRTKPCESSTHKLTSVQIGAIIFTIVFIIVMIALCWKFPKWCIFAYIITS